MARFLILILLLPLTLQAQSGKYQINTIEARSAVGTVTISPSVIVICVDSTETIYPVIDTGNLKQVSYYILEGCLNNKYYRGAAMLSESSTMSLGQGYKRYYSALYIEIRARQHYSAIRYSIYYDK